MLFGTLYFLSDCYAFMFMCFLVVLPLEDFAYSRVDLSVKGFYFFCLYVKPGKAHHISNENLPS